MIAQAFSVGFLGCHGSIVPGERSLGAVVVEVVPGPGTTIGDERRANPFLGR